MSEYSDLQSRFFYNICTFGLWLEAQGYQVGMGEGWRTEQQAAWNAEKGLGIRLSLHRDRLAIDLVIRKDGKEVGVEDYKRCGEAWKGLNGLNRWGGDFKIRDYQHFSMTYGGRS
jgi:hypothetical protein